MPDQPSRTALIAIGGHGRDVIEDFAAAFSRFGPVTRILLDRRVKPRWEKLDEQRRGPLPGAYVQQLECPLARDIDLDDDVAIAQLKDGIQVQVAMVLERLASQLKSADQWIVVCGFGGVFGSFVTEALCSLVTESSDNGGFLLEQPGYVAATLPFGEEGRRRTIGLRAVSRVKALAMDRVSIDIVDLDHESRSAGQPRPAAGAYFTSVLHQQIRRSLDWLENLTDPADAATPTAEERGGTSQRQRVDQGCESPQRRERAAVILLDGANRTAAAIESRIQSIVPDACVIDARDVVSLTAEGFSMRFGASVSYQRVAAAHIQVDVPESSAKRAFRFALASSLGSANLNSAIGSLVVQNRLQLMQLARAAGIPTPPAIACDPRMALHLALENESPFLTELRSVGSFSVAVMAGAPRAVGLGPEPDPVLCLLGAREAAFESVYVVDGSVSPGERLSVDVEGSGPLEDDPIMGCVLQLLREQAVRFARIDLLRQANGATLLAGIDPCPDWEDGSAPDVVINQLAKALIDPEARGSE